MTVLKWPPKKPEPAEVKHRLYWTSSQGRNVCGHCNDGHHSHCERFECQCAWLDPQPPRRRKPARDKNGLTEEDRRNQLIEHKSR